MGKDLWKKKKQILHATHSALNQAKKSEYANDRTESQRVLEKAFFGRRLECEGKASGDDVTLYMFDDSSRTFSASISFLFCALTGLYLRKSKHVYYEYIASLKTDSKLPDKILFNLWRLWWCFRGVSTFLVPFIGELRYFSRLPITDVQDSEALPTTTPLFQSIFAS